MAVVDATIGVGLTVVSMWEGILMRPDTGYPPMDVGAWLLYALANAPLAVRRRAPATVLLTTGAAVIITVAVGYYPASALGFGTLVALYTVASLRPWHTTAALTLVTVVVLLVKGPSYDEQTPGWLTATAMLCAGVSVAMGVASRRLADANRRLRELAAQLRREREERARHAVANERLRIARELHDVVAHQMSVVSVHGGLAKYVWDSDPPTARDALDTIVDTSEEAMRELRRLLSILRVSDAGGQSEPPSPGLDRLDELVNRVRGAGTAVEVKIGGVVRPLPAGVDGCAYRVVQEALTNVLKHAEGADTHVTIHYGPELLVIEISDRGPGPKPDYEGAGYGLIGMRERARLYGGTLSAEPGSEGGFRVMLTLPLTDAGGPTPPGTGSRRPNHAAEIRELSRLPDRLY